MNSMHQVATGAWIALAWLAGPALVLAFGVGLLFSLMQAVTQIQESSLSFAPKLGVLIVLFVVGGGAMFHGVTHYATTLYQSLPQLIAYG